MTHIADHIAKITHMDTIGHSCKIQYLTPEMVVAVAEQIARYG